MNRSCKVTDLIVKYDKALTPSECTFCIQNTANYKTHTWGTYEGESPSMSPDTEFLRSNNLNFKVKLLLNGKIYQLINEYIENICNNSWTIHAFSEIAINKYDVNTKMLPHIDHIHSIFDGDKKGIPIVTVVGLLNDNFTGGEFIFCEDFDLELKQGDVIIFPSTFAYKHSVKKIESGIRYSFVAWGY